MQYYDISVPIYSNMVVWPKDPDVILKRIQKIDEGASSNVSQLTLGVHTGTHVDAPDHFMNNGKTVENLRLDILNGRVFVLQIPDNIDKITADVFKTYNFPARVQRLLIKTRNSKIWAGNKSATFDTGFVAIPADGAEFLVKRGVRLVGIDYLSISPYGDAKETHETFLKEEVILLEGLNLTEISQGFYTLHCLPLKLVGSDGAPARAILVKR